MWTLYNVGFLIKVNPNFRAYNRACYCDRCFPVPLLLHHCSATAPPPLHHCSTTAPPLLHHCSTTAPSLLHHCSITAPEHTIRFNSSESSTEVNTYPLDYSRGIYSPSNIRFIKKSKKIKCVPITTIIFPKINLEHVELLRPKGLR